MLNQGTVSNPFQAGFPFHQKNKSFVKRENVPGIGSIDKFLLASINLMFLCLCFHYYQSQWQGMQQKENWIFFNEKRFFLIKQNATTS